MRTNDNKNIIGNYLETSSGLKNLMIRQKIIWVIKNKERNTTTTKKTGIQNDQNAERIHQN